MGNASIQIGRRSCLTVRARCEHLTALHCISISFLKIVLLILTIDTEQRHHPYSKPCVLD